MPDLAVNNLALSPAVGVEWVTGDHWGLSLLPRVELLGKNPTWAVTVPLAISWSWYL